MQIRVGHDFRNIFLPLKGISHPAFTRIFLAHFVQDLAGVPPELPNRFGNGDLIFWRGPTPCVHGMGDGVLAKGVHVLFRDAEKMHRYRERQLPQHLIYQIGLAGIDEAIDVITSQTPHHRLMVS
ncbi:hypothetical protein D3C85_1415350 [compost metagenome]